MRQQMPWTTLTALAVSAGVVCSPAFAHPGHEHESDADAPSEVGFAASGWAYGPSGTAPESDGLLVDLADDLDGSELQKLTAETGVQLTRDWDVENGNRFIVRGDASALARAKKWLEGRDEVESIEPNVFYSLLHPFEGEVPPVEPAPPEEQRPTKPNDPLYKSQWHMQMVNAEGAWSRTAGKGVIVAVIDTGVSPGQIGAKKSKYKRVPDLKETEFVKGYNFVGNSADPSDGNGHGTHVAGTIAQSTNNNLGVTGLAYQAKIMPIKVLSDRGWGSVGAIASGIRYAADNGAKVINMSLGGGGYSASMAKAMEYAHKKGVAIVCAAGNGGREKVEFPAAYPQAIAVSALGPDGKLAFYSSYGKELAIAAPGGDTRVDLNKDGIPDGVLQDTIARGDPSKHGFFPFQGTSMATPHVAAAAALVISTGTTDPDRVAEILKKSATEMGDPVRYGAGGLNAANAVKKSQRDKSFLGLGIAALLGFALVRRNRKKDPLATFRPGVGFASALVMGASGLFFLHEFGLGSGALGVLSHPLGEWPALALGMDWHLNALVGSAALALVPMALLFGFGKLRGVLAGFAVGVAGFLLARAALGSVDVGWVPGHGMLDFAWLTANGAIAAMLGRIAMMRD